MTICVVCLQLQFSCERHLTQLATMRETGEALSKCLALIVELKDFEKLSKVTFVAVFTSVLCIIACSCQLSLSS